MVHVWLKPCTILTGDSIAQGEARSQKNPLKTIKTMAAWLNQFHFHVIMHAIAMLQSTESFYLFCLLGLVDPRGRPTVTTGSYH